MKKQLAAGLALLLLFALVGMPTARVDDPIALTVESVSGTRGKTVAVQILAANYKGMDSLQFRINYDPAALRLIDVSPGSFPEGDRFVANTATDGLIRVAFASKLGLTEDGTFLTMRFEVLTATGSAIVLTDALASRVYADQNYLQAKAYLSVTDGSVTVGDAAAIPAAIVTPWPVETPLPTPSPEPTPTPAPTAEPVAAGAAGAPQKTAVPTAPAASADDGPEPTGSGTGAILIACGAALILLAVGITLLARRKPASKRSGKTDRTDED